MASLSLSSATLAAALIDACFRTTYDEAVFASHALPNAGSADEKYQFTGLFTESARRSQGFSSRRQPTAGAEAARVRQQLIKPTGVLRRQSRQDVFQIGIGNVLIKLSGLDETHHCGLTPARAS
jgi:hypothetical protein